MAKKRDDLELDADSTSLETLARQVGETAAGRIAFGNPVERKGITVIPVARVMWGFGRGGSTDGTTPGPNGGGGVMVRPAGYIEISNRKAAFHGIGGWSGLVPLLLTALVLGAALGALLRGR